MDLLSKIRINMYIETVAKLKDKDIISREQANYLVKDLVPIILNK